MGSKLLSLVVIFTQSIQLSKIVERIALQHYRCRTLGRLEHSCSRFNLYLLFSSRSSTSSRLRLLKHIFREVNGGAERDRTVDPLLAKQVLSQLSYSPYAHQYSNVRESGGPG